MIINGKEIEIKKVTVGINNKYMEMLLKGSTLDGQTGQMSMDLSREPSANLFLVASCTGCTEEEVSEWWVDEYQEVLNTINWTKKVEKKN